MFDTIHMSVPFTINHDDLLIINDDKILSFIKYNPDWNRLIINCSIPKILYGNNVHEITEKDIDVFFTIVTDRIKELFKVEVYRDDWQAYRLDLCKNFKLDNGNQLNEYISKLSKIKLPYKDTFLRNNETVEFYNKSAKVHFYNKLKQLKKERIKDSALLKQAENILRFEIQLKRDGLNQYDKQRRAVDLLTTEFYEQVLNEYLEVINTKLEKVTDELELSPEIFNVGLTIAKIERVFSFMAFLDEFGEPFLKNIYDKSYYNRQKDVTEYFQKLKMKQNNKLSL